MKKLVCLIDPSWDYHKLVKTINSRWSELSETTEIWIGCTQDNGKKTKKVLNELKIPKESKFLFPGTIGQGILAGGEVSAVFVPKVLGRGVSPKRMIVNFAVKAGELSVKLLHRKTKMIPYLYLVLSKESRVGRKVDADKICDEEALELLKKNIRGAHHIYIEGGSNAEHSVAERLNLLGKIKETFEIPLYCGGGIKSPEDFKRASELADKVIVGHYLGENPEKISEFSSIVKNLNQTREVL